jgi:hypothetical protein
VQLIKEKVNVIVLSRFSFLENILSFHSFRVSLSIFLVLLFGCASKNTNVKHFSVESPGQKWFIVKEGGADFAWYNKEIQGAIYVDSNCKQKFEDRPLRDSYISLTQGIAVGNPIKQNTRIIAEREALFTVQNGSLDGVSVRFASVVLSKDECLYDFLYIATPEYFSTGLKDFLYAAQSFSTMTRKTEGFQRQNKTQTEKTETPSKEP